MTCVGTTLVVSGPTWTRAFWVGAVRVCPRSSPTPTSTPARNNTATHPPPKGALGTTISLGRQEVPTRPLRRRQDLRAATAVKGSFGGGLDGGLRVCSSPEPSLNSDTAPAGATPVHSGDTGSPVSAGTPTQLVSGHREYFNLYFRVFTALVCRNRSLSVLCPGEHTGH